MHVEIAVPHVPADLAPGTRTTVPVELHNPSGAAVSVRLSVARGRVGDWAAVEPATADLAPGGHTTVEVIFEPPAGTAADAALLPFTVRAADAADDARIGSATGLVRLSGPNDLTATLGAEVGTAVVGRYALWVQNRGTAAVSLGLAVRLEPGAGRATVEPAVVEVAPGGTATARVTTHPRRRLAGGPTSYGVVVAGRDLSGGGDGRQVLTVRADGAAPARTGAAVALAVLAVLVVAGALVAWLAPDRLPFRDREATPPAGTAPAGPGAVRRPYVMVDSRPQLAPADRAAAEATLAQLTAVGLPVRLVDSKTSDEIADGTNGFWVVLHDGFATAEEADAFCARFRGVTPQCEVVR
ncbi:SPOR domain-containing protein [Actinoplanes sp. NPDC049599]|uniref:COG1470 family protein n=1 Tax=Actinoplanes sp. NPDC049599 TaxID=3363903 RepID=UPI0037ADE023